MSEIKDDSFTAPVIIADAQCKMQTSKYPTVEFWRLLGWACVWLSMGGCVALIRSCHDQGTPMLTIERK